MTSSAIANANFPQLNELLGFEDPSLLFLTVRVLRSALFLAGMLRSFKYRANRCLIVAARNSFSSSERPHRSFGVTSSRFLLVANP